MHTTTPPTVREITPEEVDRYRRDGVVHLPQFVAASDVVALLEAADHWRAEPSTHKEHLSPDGRFVDGLGIWPTEPAFASYVFDSMIAREAARAMGSREARFYFDHMFLLDADTAKDNYYWHQDVAYWSVDGTQICSFWLAMTPCDVDSGALEFVLRTGDGPLYSPAAFGTEDDSRYQGITAVNSIPPFHELRDQYDIVSFAIEPGDALLFTSQVVHSSRGNHSKTNRRAAYSTRWLGDDAVYYPRDAATDDITTPSTPIEPGAPMKLEQYPLLWPR